MVLLRGTGCVYKRCTFCDYHSDFCLDDEQNFQLNKEVLSNVTGQYHNLEVINSGSVFELGRNTLQLIKGICYSKNIDIIHFESHYLYKNRIGKLRKEFADFKLKLKIGLETFDYDFREGILNKGIPEKSPKKIAENFDEANFLFGLTGQTYESMTNDIELGLSLFERICINIMCENSTNVLPDKKVIATFLDRIYPHIKDNRKIDILINNTDFGVGD